MAAPVPTFYADGVFVVSVQTEGGNQRDRARVQVRQAISEVLSAILGVPAGAIDVQSAPGQAPRVAAGGSDIGCSFSHEAGLSLAAINLRGAIGVDIMRIAGIPDWQAVARDYLGPDVTASLLALPAMDRPRAFAQAWTAREARLKCAGRQLGEWTGTAALPAASHSVALDLGSGFAGALAW
jgi:4'-phosphopantetheinyl transferase